MLHALPLLFAVQLAGADPCGNIQGEGTLDCVYGLLATEQVTLRGQLQRLQSFGPPNYGENPESDKKLTLFILSLGHPVGDDAPFLDASPYGTGTEVQLVLGTAYFQNLATEGACLVATGEMFPAHTGYHRRDVLLHVRELERCED
ncbi:MAG: hypothetical protein EP335_15475 [Alphaproteobacteria bacterium]|nr:MAG: hypothetical protein EP335_15475 [Alphaproteobacteria bacterium]